MSLDRSLKIQGSLTRHRNVLTRTERVLLMEEEGQWETKDGVFGLPKTGHRKAHVGGKAKESAETAEGEGDKSPTKAAETK